MLRPQRELYLPYKDTDTEQRIVAELRELEVEVENDVNTQGISDEERYERAGRGVHLLDKSASDVFYGRPITMAGLYSETNMILDGSGIIIQDNLKYGIVKGDSVGYSIVSSDLFTPGTEETEKELVEASAVLTAQHAGRLVVCHVIALETHMAFDTHFRWQMAFNPRALAPIGASSMYDYESPATLHKRTLDTYKELFEVLQPKQQVTLQDAVLELLNNENPLNALIVTAAELRKVFSSLDGDSDVPIEIIIEYLKAILDGTFNNAVYQSSELPPLIAHRNEEVFFANQDDDEKTAFSIVDIKALPHYFPHDNRFSKVTFGFNQHGLYAEIIILNREDERLDDAKFFLPLEHANLDAITRLY